MKHDTVVTPEARRKLAQTKMNWQNGIISSVATVGLRVMEFTPLKVKPHARQAEMDAFSAIPSYVPKTMVIE